MTRAAWTWLVIAVTVAAIIYFPPYLPPPVQFDIPQYISSGAIQGMDTTKDSGICQTAPQDWLDDLNARLAAANDSRVPITLDEGALARCVQSEHGNDSDTVQLWIAHAVINHAGGIGNVASVLLAGSGAASGTFHSQSVGGTYASTIQDPRARALTNAISAARGTDGGDPTGGATNFFAPHAQDWCYQQKLAGNPKFAKYMGGASTTRAKWAASGMTLIGPVPGESPDLVEFWRA